MTAPPRPTPRRERLDCTYTADSQPSNGTGARQRRAQDADIIMRRYHCTSFLPPADGHPKHTGPLTEEDFEELAAALDVEAAAIRVLS